MHAKFNIGTVVREVPPELKVAVDHSPRASSSDTVGSGEFILGQHTTTASGVDVTVVTAAAAAAARAELEERPPLGRDVGVHRRAISEQPLRSLAEDVRRRRAAQ
jgi:hypothetical protein